MVRHIVIVCGYGCHLVPELQDYLLRVVRFCNENQPDCLIFCGGFTQQKSAPNTTEAEVMKWYVIQRLKYEPKFVYMEENSYTTLDNIENAAKSMREDGLLAEETLLTVFCEATRALKIDLLVRHFIGRRANIETASWDLMSPAKQIVSTLYEWAAIKFSPLARYFRNKRLERAEQI